MKRETKAKKKVIGYYRTCDVCGAKIAPRSASMKAECMCCRRDLCGDCIEHEEGAGGDYRDVWCKQCWSTGAEYRPKINKLNAEIERLHGEWYTKSNEHVKNNR